jgi:hypothetical protein
MITQNIFKYQSKMEAWPNYNLNPRYSIESKLTKLSLLTILTPLTKLTQLTNLTN